MRYPISYGTLTIRKSTDRERKDKFVPPSGWENIEGELPKKRKEKK